MSIGLFLAMQVATGATQAAPSPIDTDEVIIVTARRLSDAQVALTRCIERGCPPDEEMRAWLKQVDAQFLSGDYPGARNSLDKARDRNRRYARQHPVLVSELWRADSRLSSLLGLRDESQIAARGAVAALREGLPSDDGRVLVQQLEVGDSHAMGGNFERAVAQYREVMRRARVTGSRAIEGRAMLRTAILYAAVARREQPYVEPARRLLAEIDATTDEALGPVREAARVVRLKLDLALDPKGGPDLAAWAASVQRGRNPVLIYAPPIETRLPGARSAQEIADSIHTADFANPLNVERVFPINYNLTDQWADVGFRIASDGTVSEIDTLRRGHESVERWLSRARDGLAKRRYAPFGDGPDDPGVYRIERYSLVSDMTTVTGSHIPSRAGEPHVEVVDLTASKIGIPATNR